ncbi:MAG: putative GNAT family N-acyltransferase [Limisphaerales bacterium]|jgi:predicted GNAT family N-acyltransferase
MWIELQVGSAEAIEASELRTMVFLDILGIDPECPELNQGGTAFGWYEGDELAASMVLERPEPSTVVFSRVAVKAALRGQGVGKMMLKTAEKWAAQNGSTKVILFAHRGSKQFYERLGYQKMGIELVLENIPHQRMELLLKSRINVKEESSKKISQDFT